MGQRNSGHFRIAQQEGQGIETSGPPTTTKQSVRKATWLFVLSLAAFFVCAFLVVTGVTTQWDQSTFLLLNDFAPNVPFVNALMYVSSQYGREIVWPVLAIFLVLSKKQSHRRTAFYIIVALLAEIIPGYGSQYAVNRIRPDAILSGVHVTVPALVEPSFPSGHALVVCAYLVVVFFTWHNRKAWALLTLDAALVTFARVYVGEHFPMDAIAGVFLGIAIGSAVMVFRPRLDPLFLRLDRKWKAKVVDRIRREKKPVDDEKSALKEQSFG